MTVTYDPVLNRYRAACGSCSYIAVRAKREAAEHAIAQHIAYEHDGTERQEGRAHPAIRARGEGRGMGRMIFYEVDLVQARKGSAYHVLTLGRPICGVAIRRSVSAEEIEAADPRAIRVAGHPVCANCRERLGEIPAPHPATEGGGEEEYELRDGTIVTASTTTGGTTNMAAKKNSGKGTKSASAPKPAAAKKAGGAARSSLTEAQAKTLATALAPILKGKNGETSLQIGRYADKHARFRLGVRGTGPHQHGLDLKMRTSIHSAIDKAFGLEAMPPKETTKSKAAAPATPRADEVLPEAEAEPAAV